MIEVTGLKTGIKYYIPSDMVSSMDHDRELGFTVVYMKKEFVGKSDRYQVSETPEEILFSDAMIRELLGEL